MANNISCGAQQASGKHGSIIDMCCETTNTKVYKNVLCKLLEQEVPNLEYVQLYKNDMDIRKMTTEEEFLKLIQLIKNASKNGVKKLALKRCNDKQSMVDDVRSAFLVRDKLYTGTNQKYTQIQTLSYEGYEFTGLELKLKKPWYSFNFTLTNTNQMFFYISQRCLKTVDDVPMTDDDLSRFSQEIQDSLSILHKQDYYHGDVKAKNIMTCGDQDITYKLIDWGRLRSIKTFDPDYGYGGSTQAGSPLGFYFLQRKYRNPFALQTTLAYLDTSAYKELRRYEAFSKDYWPRIKQSFSDLMDQAKKNSWTDKMLFDAFKYTLDTFNFGLTILFLVLKNNLDLNSYRSQIDGYVIYPSTLPSNAKQSNTANAKNTK